MPKEPTTPELRKLRRLAKAMGWPVDKGAEVVPPSDVEALRSNVQSLRNEVRCAALLRPYFELLAIQMPDHSFAFDLRQEFGIEKRQKRQGNVDFVVSRILSHHRVRSIACVPELISECGMLATSDLVGRVAEVMDDYARIQDPHYQSPWLPAYFNGPDPRLELVKFSPSSYFETQTYCAPVEELFDELAVFLFINRRSGDAEDGAMGWLVEYVLRHHGWELNRLLNLLHPILKRCSIQRLADCHKIWLEVVSPCLNSGDFWRKSYFLSQSS